MWPTGRPLARLQAPERRVAVLGLGRFGTSLARTLHDEGAEVLVVDRDSERVENVADTIAGAVVADTTDPDALTEIGVPEFDHVVVAIGTNMEASILTCSAVSDLGVEDVWAKAVTPRHGRILERVGAHHVVYPEVDTGRRIAHVVTGHLLEFAPFGDHFAVARTRVPDSLVGRDFDPERLARRYHVTVGWWRHPEGAFESPRVGEAFRENDELLVGGEPDAVTAFASLD